MHTHMNTALICITSACQRVFFGNCRESSSVWLCPEWKEGLFAFPGVLVLCKCSSQSHPQPAFGREQHTGIQNAWILMELWCNLREQQPAPAQISAAHLVRAEPCSPKCVRPPAATDSFKNWNLRKSLSGKRFYSAPAQGRVAATCLAPGNSSYSQSWASTQIFCSFLTVLLAVGLIFMYILGSNACWHFLFYAQGWHRWPRTPRNSSSWSDL